MHAVRQVREHGGRGIGQGCTGGIVCLEQLCQRTAGAGTDQVGIVCSGVRLTPGRSLQGLEGRREEDVERSRNVMF